MQIDSVIKTIQSLARYTFENYKKPNFQKLPTLFLWGCYGIGKSTIVSEIAQEFKAGFVDRRMAQDDQTDFKGIPDLKSGDEFSRWKPPADIPFEGNTNVPETGIWFLDEFNLANKSVMKAGYEAILDHRLGGKPLKKGWIIIAAGNERGQSAFVEDLPKPLETRFWHITLDTNLESWTTWAMKHDIVPEIIAFLNWKMDFFCKIDVKNSFRGAPIPRTWEFVSRLWNVVPPETRASMVTGCVGESASVTFFAYLEYYKELPDINKIIEGENLIPTKREILIAVCTSLVAYTKGIETTKIKKVYTRILEYAEKLDSEFSVFLVKTLIKAVDEKQGAIIGMLPQFRSWIAKNPSLKD